MMPPVLPAKTPLDDGSQAAIDRFVDALWIEDGLAALTLAAYRRDLTLYVRWLQSAGDRSLDATTEADLLGFMAARHAATRATTANRRLTVFKRYFRWALREHRVLADPTLRLLAAHGAPPEVSAGRARGEQLGRLRSRRRHGAAGT
jgi:integrase/recombinase XerD